jgi:SAM-dependent methyltransferase
MQTIKMNETTKDLVRIYRRRFSETAAYRWKVWSVLTQSYFSRWVDATAPVLDLGCGYGEFINQIAASQKLAMDMNPDVPQYLNGDVQFLQQDCSKAWPLPTAALGTVFTSNFFEHLPNKECLSRTLAEAFRCIRPGGKLIAMGPNIKYLPGRYWDFYDHHTILTETSLGEALDISGFRLILVVPRFLPYTIVNVRQYPLWMVRAYLKVPIAWRFLGRQFLLIAERTSGDGQLASRILDQS